MLQDELKPSLQTVRTLAAEFFLRTVKPAVIITVIILAVLLVVSIWLTAVSAWWWILLVLVVIASIVVAAALTAVWFIVKTVVRPVQSKQQRTQAKAIVDKMQNVAEVTATPAPLLLFRIAKDVVMPSKQGFISSVSQNATSLTKDVAVLRDSFKEAN